MKLDIYSKDGQLKLTVAPESNNAESLGIQEESTLALTFTDFACIPLEVYDYTEFQGRRYWVTERYVPKMNARKEWSYSVSLHGVEGLAAQTLMVNPDDGDNPVLILSAPAREHAALIVANLNRRMGTTEWKVGEVVVSEYIDIEYTGKYASDALSELSEAAETEWWFDGMTLNISRCEFGESIPLSYGNGLLGGISRTTADGVKFFTRLFPVGSSRNIDPDTYGHARLQLPDGATYVEQDTQLGIIEHYEQAAFEEIFPRRVGRVGTVRSEEATGDDGEPFTIWYFTDPDIPFDPNEYEIGGLVKRVTFQSGELRGREFEVNYDTEKKEFEIITQWPYDDDLQLPSEPLIPASGDEYILWNIRMPESYYPAAEQEYKEAVDQFMADNRKDVSVWQASTDFTVIERRGLDLRPGQRVRLESAGAFPDTGFRETRIVSISRSVVRPGSMTLKMSDVLSTGRISRIESNIATVERLTRQVSAEFPDIIKSWEETPASDTTVYSARKSEREFLNKRRGGRVEGGVAFDRPVAFGDGLASEDFRQGNISGTGFKIGRDENGNYVLETDRAVFRKDVSFNELVINQISFTLGETVFSSGGCEISRIESLDSVYRCYYDNKDGRRYSGFVVDDLARCQRYSPDRHSIIKYYWRAVIAVGDDYVDLSKTNVDGTGIPDVGDNIVQFGNLVDRTRQSAVIIDPRNGGSVEVYAHLNSYDLSEKSYAGIGVNPETGEAYMYAYGDMYFGDRDISAEGANFITYQKAAGDTKRKLRISADVQIGAGSSGLTNLSEWAEKQQQIDNAQTTADEAKDAVDNIKVGGVNLIDQSEYFKGRNDGGKWIIQGGSNAPVFEEYQGYMSMVCKTNGAPFSYPGAYLPVEIDTTQQYISTYYVFATEACIIRCGLEKGASKSMVMSLTADQVGKWVRIENIQTSTTASNNFQVGVQALSETLVAAFRMGQLETGNKATSWKESENDRQEKIAAAQTAAEAAQQSADNAAAGVDALKNFTDDAFADGVINRAESAAIEKYTNSVTETKDAVDAAYETVYNNTLLAGTAKSNLQAAKSTFDTAVADLLASIQTASQDGIATPEEKSDVDSKYSAFNIAYGAFSTRIEEANKYIQTAINTTAQGAYQLSQELQSVVNNLNDTIIPDLQDQIDKQIVSYNGTDIPTLDNYPASDWTDDTERARHVNDYYDRKITDEDGEVSYERYKFAYENSVYQWVRIADSGAAEAQAKALEALGVANGKNKVYFGDSTPTAPYIINDLWIKTSGDIYISNADRAEGATGSVADWQLVNDAQLRLRQMSSDDVISKEEKATLRNRLAQMQKEYTSYQSDATTYGVSISALQTAYTNLTTFLTGTVAVNNDTDTTLTEEQRPAYNTYFAAYDAEVSRFTNLVADAIAQGKVDAIEVGAVNIVKRGDYGLADVVTYSITTISLHKALVSGNKYTLIISGNVTGNQRFGLWDSAGSMMQGAATRIQDNIYSLTFTFRPSTNANDIVLRLYNYPSSTASDNPCDVDWVCLYEGDVKVPYTFVESIYDVQEDIDAAQAAADEAKADAAENKSQLDKWASDSYISPTEKTALKQQQADIQAEYAEIIAQAGQYGISTTTYTSAYTAANTALTKYTASSPESITIESDYANIAAYYTARQTILDAIAQAAKKYVDDLEFSSINLIDGSESIVVTAPASNKYYAKNIDISENVSAGDNFAISIDRITDVVGAADSYTINIYDKAVTTGLSNTLYLSKDNRSGVFEILSTVESQEAVLRLFAGTSGQTAGRTIQYDKVMFVRGNKPALSWQPSYNDQKALIQEGLDSIQYLKDAFSNQVTEISNGVVLTGAVVTREGDKIRAGVTNGQDNLPFIMADVQDDQDFQNAGYALFKNGVVRLSDQMQYMLQAPGEGLEFGLLQNGTAKRSMGITPQQFQMASGDNPFQSLLNVTGSKGSRVLTNVSVYSDQVKMLSYPVVEYLLTNLPIHGIEAATNVVQVPAIQIVAEVSGNDNIASLDVEIAFKNRQSGTLVPIYQVYGQQSGRGVPVYVFYDGGTFNLVTGNYDIVLTATISCFNGMAGNNYEYSLTSSATGLLTYETESGEVRSDIYGNGYIFGKSPSQYIGFFNNEARTVFQIRCGNVGFMVSEAGIRKWDSSTNKWISL